MNFRNDVRRCLLKSAGLTLTLPMLQSTTPVAASDKPSPASDASESLGDSKRLICVGSNLGLYRKAFYPQQTGRDYQTSALLKPLERHRSDFTVFSGFDHRAGNGHGNWDNYLSIPDRPRSWCNIKSSVFQWSV